MSVVDAKSIPLSASMVPRIAGIKRLLWQGPARVLLSIVLVLIAAALYSLLPTFRSNNILYICVLLGLFGGSIWGFEALLERIAGFRSKESDETRSDRYLNSSHVPYNRDELIALLNSLKEHRRAVNQEYPDLFEQFRAEARQKEILIVQDVEPDVELAAELLRTAFHDFGFKVVITSPEADQRFLNIAREADLVVWDAKVSMPQGIEMKAWEAEQFGHTRIIAVSAITRRPDILRSVFSRWLNQYPTTFGDAFFWHLFQAAMAIPKNKAEAASSASLTPFE